MGKLKKVISRIPLIPSLIIVMSFFIIVAVILSKTTMSFVSEKIQLIEAKYISVEQEIEEVVFEEEENGDLFGDDLFGSEEDDEFFGEE